MTIPEFLTDLPLAIVIPVALVALLVLRRVPIVGPVVNLIAWLAIGTGLYFAIDQRARLDPYLGSVAKFLQLDRQEVVGEEVRIAMSQDGHFWAKVRFGGIEQRMLVDSGATVTAISTDTAARAGLKVEAEPFPLLIRTANGTIEAKSGEIGELRLGNIVARDLAVVVSPAFGETNVIGMNFLSRLQSWRVEGRTLVLVPHHPQKDAG